MSHSYSIVMFAYNEERNIVNSVSSVFSNVNENLDQLFVLANGCTDSTVAILKELQKKYDKLNVIEFSLGDKCNAWNEYVHNIAPQSDAHFFVDADVQFTKQVFPNLTGVLNNSNTANAVAGLPFSGRNKAYYRSLVTDRSCLFGNCYGLSKRFINLIREKKFKLPIGLCWIDSAITKAVNTDIDEQHNAFPNRVVHDPKCGYTFSSLNFFKIDDIKLYLSRIARYQTGKFQECYLEKLEFNEWPKNLNEINQTILKEISEGKIKPTFYLKSRIIKRLSKKL